MGIIAKQTIKGTIWSYLGVILGFITTAYLFPNYLTPEVVGLFGLLASISVLMGQLSLLGLPGVTNRLFSYFRNKENGHNGFLRIALLFHIVGLIVFLLAFYFLKPYLIKTNIEDSPLFAQYLYLLVPMTIAVMVFTFLDSFNKMLYNAVFGTFLQEFLQRFLILGITLFFIFKLINLDLLIIGYAFVISLKAIIIIFFLVGKKEINLKPPKKSINNKMQKEIINVALFSLITGMGSTIVFSIDKIIVNQMLNLTNTGIYTIAFYFGSLVVMPSRSLLKISGTLVADAWKKNDKKTIKNIYYKSCLNQLIIGGFLFLGIWANIDNILIILGDDYTEAKWVIFFIGVGYLIDMITGANGQVITLSKHYKIMFLFVVIIVVSEIILLYLLIPIYGVTGGAIAVALSLLINNLARYVYLYKRYHFQPFNIHFLYIIAFYFAIYAALQIIPQVHFIIDLFIRSSLITISSIIFFTFVPISVDIRNLFVEIIRRLKQ